MTQRDSHVVHAHEILGYVPLKVLAEGLVAAINESEAEGVEPDRDPAVMLFGAFIAFHTHADVMHVRGYHDLIEQCQERHDRKEQIQ